MKRSSLILLFSTVVMALVMACSMKPALISRWYTPEQVTIGQPLYATYCAGCHGEKGEGAPNSDAPLPNGSYPPQPLNGSGHSWHHSLSDLEKTIELGGSHPGATMPGFAKALNHEQRMAVIAAFQNLWEDRTYSGWIRRGGLN